MALPPWRWPGRLRHLDGLVFFDTSGNFPSGACQPVSVIAACPDSNSTGEVSMPPAILELLRTTLAARPGTRLATTVSPSAVFAGGWNMGRFVFGDYPEMLVYEPPRPALVGTRTLVRLTSRDNAAAPAEIIRPSPPLPTAGRIHFRRRPDQGMDRRRRRLSGEPLPSLHRPGEWRVAVRPV